MKYFFLLLTTASFALTACAVAPKITDGVPAISAVEYAELSASKTRMIESYDGLQNQLAASVTKLDDEMTQAMLAKSAQIYEWNSVTYDEEKKKAADRLMANTEYFVSFYTPERNQNNLNSPKSIWKLYLDVNGQRFEGKATKIKNMLADLQTVYPRHNRFSTPYKIEFPVATRLTEGRPQTLTITGPSAAVKLSF